MPGDTPQKMTVLQKFYLIFVPERHFCGVSLCDSYSARPRAFPPPPRHHQHWPFFADVLWPDWSDLFVRMHMDVVVHWASDIVPSPESGQLGHRLSDQVF
jgi:hypothetical protein